jgi:hypothetical protein
MKKYLYAFLISFIIMIILGIISYSTHLKFDFLIGWFSCMGYYITLQYMEEKENG